MLGVHCVCVCRAVLLGAVPSHCLHFVCRRWSPPAAALALASPLTQVTHDLSRARQLFVEDAAIGSTRTSEIRLRIISDSALHALHFRNMLVRGQRGQTDGARVTCATSTLSSHAMQLGAALLLVAVASASWPCVGVCCSLTAVACV